MGALRRLPFAPTELKYVAATVEFEGETYENVGIRFKGNSSLMNTQGSLKRPFKLDFNRFVKGRTCFGLSKLNLNNNAMDPTQMREVLSYDVFRNAGVASPRTAYAKVYLTVPGRSGRQSLSNQRPV